MSLAEGKEMIQIIETDFVDASGALRDWQDWPASNISHHGAPCCDVAREWVLAMDYSQLNASPTLTGPRWLRQKYTWGPSCWPIHWCEAVKEETLDCGALAALSHEVFTARGLTSFPVQLIQHFSDDATRQWRERWGARDIPVRWIMEDLIYHEGCAVLVGDDEIKVWDASTGCWVDPKQRGGYGSLLALRVFDSRPDRPAAFRWGQHLVVPNEWQKVERSRASAAPLRASALEASGASAG